MKLRRLLVSAVLVALVCLSFFAGTSAYYGGSDGQGHYVIERAFVQK